MHHRHATPYAEHSPRLILLADARDAEGTPRIALAIGAAARRQILLFPSVAAALAAKARLEVAALMAPLPAAAAPRPLDFAGIARAALPHLETLCARWLPGGHRSGVEWVCGSLAGDRGDSCKVNLRTGKWCDFASGEGGRDAIALAAAIHRITQAEAARRLAVMLGIEASAHA